MRGKYIIGLFLSLGFGFGLASWRATAEFGPRLQAAAHLAAMAQLAAEERANALGEKLDQETEARETAEQAWEKVANRAADLGQQLIEQIGATRKLEAKLADLENKLQFANQKIASQVAADKEVQTGLYNAKAQIPTLSAMLEQKSGNKEAAGAARMEAEAEAKAAAEKAALEINARKAASKMPLPEGRASPDRPHKFPVRRQTQTRARLPAKKQHPAWWPSLPAL
jgi:hypothetical protein